MADILTISDSSTDLTNNVSTVLYALNSLLEKLPSGKLTNAERDALAKAIWQLAKYGAYLSGDLTLG